MIVEAILESNKLQGVFLGLVKNLIEGLCKKKEYRTGLPFEHCSGGL